MTLREFILTLDRIPYREALIRYDFADVAPTDFYRYPPLNVCLGYATVGEPFVKDILARAKATIGRIEEGYIAETYKVAEGCYVYACNWNGASRGLITGIVPNEDRYIITTNPDEIGAAKRRD